MAESCAKKEICMDSALSLVNVMERFSGKRILIIGDLMVDHYILGNVNRISPEAPIPVVDASSYIYKLGGADDFGRWIMDELENRGVTDSCLLVSQDRPTTTKTRIVVKGQHLMRVDHEKRDPIDSDLMKHIITFVKDNVDDIDGVIFSDYE